MPFSSAGVTVARSDGRPLYAQVGEAVRHQIEGRTMLPGEALPSEAELQRVFGVARSVVRQALEGLVRAGVVQRTQGRVTIVAPSQQWRRELGRAGGLEQQLAAQGQQLTTSLTSFELAWAPQEAESVLGTRETWEIERVRFVDEEPMAFVRTWVPRHLFPDLDVQALREGGSLHALMRASGHTPYGGRRHVQAVPADEHLAQVLGEDVGAPLLLLAGTTADQDGQGLEWFDVWHRGQTVFDVDAAVSPPARAGGPADLAGLDELRESVRVLSGQVGVLQDQVSRLG